jgi:hypothetical protein
VGAFSKHVATKWMLCPVSSGIILVARLVGASLGEWHRIFDVAESIFESMCRVVGNGVSLNGLS